MPNMSLTDYEAIWSLAFAFAFNFYCYSSSVYDASAFSDDCVQYLGSGSTTLATPALLAYGAAMGGGTPGHPHNYSENCLSVNVWTKPQTGEKQKAVMLWIYGGGKRLHSKLYHARGSC